MSPLTFSTVRASRRLGRSAASEMGTVHLMLFNGFSFAAPLLRVARHRITELLIGHGAYERAIGFVCVMRTHVRTCASTLVSNGKTGEM